MTFGIIAENRKVPVVSMETKAVGEVEQSGMQFTFKRVTIRPRIVLSANATDEQISMATDMAHKAELYCIVTNAVRGKVEVVLEPEIVRE
jgi:organic hydroperoxide reductase OsmC/OhrA